MKKRYNLAKKPDRYRWFFLAFILCFPFSCQEDDYYDVPSDQKSNIMEQLRGLEQFSTTAEALEAAGLDEVIGGSGLYTLFAPTNEAWQAFFNQNDLNGLSDLGQEQLVGLIGYHTGKAMWFSFDFPRLNINNFQTYIDKFLKIDYKNDPIRIDDAQVIQSLQDIEASNGAIHGINKVLLPRINISNFLHMTYLNEDVLDTYFTILEENFLTRIYDEQNSLDIDNDGIIDSVFIYETDLDINWREEDDDRFTFLAPTDQAWEVFFNKPEIPYNSLADVPKSVLQYIIEYLSSEEAYEKDEISDSFENITEIDADKDPSFSPDMVEATIDGSNGIVHLLNEVPIPPSFNSLSGKIEINPENNTNKFAIALQKAGLLDDLRKEKNITVLVPTDQAFTEAGIDVDKLSGTDLDPIVQYHILNASEGILAYDNISNQSYATRLGNFITAKDKNLIDAKGNVATIVKSGNEASNGLIHKIDKVLIPPAEDVLVSLKANSNYQILVEAIQKAEMEDLINASGITLFAPTNAAFANLYQKLGITDLNNLSKEQLKDILSYHLVNKRILFNQGFSADLITAYGEKTISVNYDQMMVTDAAGNAVSLVPGDANVQAINGVIHAVNEVLLTQ